MGNIWGQAFRVTTFGESHGPAVGAVIDGCPARLPLSLQQVQADLDRRRPGQSILTTARAEADRAEILSGWLDNRTTGTPLTIQVVNADARGGDYARMADSFRPSHADYTYQAKYGIRAKSGGGRASARETVGRVAAGAVARQLLAHGYGVEILAFVREVHGIRAAVDVAALAREAVDASPVRCPDPARAADMEAAILAARAAGDSLGGVVEAVVRHVPAGWGEPVFDKLDADLAKAMLSLPACKGFEIGSGFAGTLLKGSEHNDAFFMADGRVRTRTNHSGGVQGGISNGEPLILRAAFKPTATIARAQETVTAAGAPATVEGHGRHDPCVLPRAVPIVEAMVALVLADHALRQRVQRVG